MADRSVSVIFKTDLKIRMFCCCNFITFIFHYLFLYFFKFYKILKDCYWMLPALFMLLLLLLILMLLFLKIKDMVKVIEWVFVRGLLILNFDIHFHFYT